MCLPYSQVPEKLSSIPQPPKGISALVKWTMTSFVIALPERVLVKNSSSTWRFRLKQYMDRAVGRLLMYCRASSTLDKGLMRKFKEALKLSKMVGQMACTSHPQQRDTRDRVPKPRNTSANNKPLHNNDGQNGAEHFICQQH